MTKIQTEMILLSTKKYRP